MARIADVIKYEGDTSTFVWKHPIEDFNTMTQLIVHESQEAVFFMNGQALDTFGPGRHTLKTQNIPLIKSLLNKVTDDKTPFHCEVYFINKTVQMGIKWGTDSKVRYIDSDSGVPLEIGASGELNLQVSNSRKLLTKLIGTMSGIAWTEKDYGFTKSLQNSFRPLISTAVKSNLTSSIKAGNFNILEVDEHLDELSTVLQEKIQPGFDEYGLTIPQFYLTTVALPEDDTNFRKIKELHTISLQMRMAQAEANVTAARRKIELERQTTQTEIAKREAERKVIRAQAEAQAQKAAGITEAEIMAAKGYNQKDVIEAEVQKARAEALGNINIQGGSGSGTMGDMLGLGVGMAVAQVIAPQMKNIISDADPAVQGTQPQVSQSANAQIVPANISAEAEKAVCPRCGSKLPANAKFCLECGAEIVNISDNEIICPICKKKTPKGKFCMECGAALIKKCSKCGAEMPYNGKFCTECGASLERKCPDCGAALPENGKFCLNCGKKL